MSEPAVVAEVTVKEIVTDSVEDAQEGDELGQCASLSARYALSSLSRHLAPCLHAT